MAEIQPHVVFEDKTIRFADSDTSRASDDFSGKLSKSRTISGYEWTKLEEKNTSTPTLEKSSPTRTASGYKWTKIDEKDNFVQNVEDPPSAGNSVHSIQLQGASRNSIRKIGPTHREKVHENSSDSTLQESITPGTTISGYKWSKRDENATFLQYVEDSPSPRNSVTQLLDPTHQSTRRKIVWSHKEDSESTSEEASSSREIMGYKWSKLDENNRSELDVENPSSARNSVTQLLGPVRHSRRRVGRQQQDVISEGDAETSQDETSTPTSTRKRRTFRDLICSGFSAIINQMLVLVYGRPPNNEGDDIEYGPIRFVPHSLSTLTRTTNFTKEELKTMYRTFKNECPTGVVYEETFKSIYAQFFPSGDANMYSHYLFNAFDNNQEGYICFEDFVNCLSSLLRGKFEEKLQWVFKLYDINHDGFITREEMQDIVKSVYSLLGPPADGGETSYSYIEHADRVFRKLDENNDGYVTYPEFVEVCSKDPSVIASMKIFETDM